MKLLDGKTILVTGAASGIGAACAELGRSHGASVFAIDRDAASLDRLADRLNVACDVADVTDVDALPDVVRRCAERTGRLDGLVNAAGIFQTCALLDITPADFDAMYETNVRALFFLQQAAAKQMLKHGGGSIVNIASVAARIPRPISSHYAASKAAVVSLTSSAATALAGQGIRVNAICPGVIDTPMVAAIRQDRAALLGQTAEDIEAAWRQRNPSGRLGRPDEVAQLAVFLLADAASYITGESIGVNGGSNED